MNLHEITKDQIIDLAVKIYKEIAKRKKNGKMNYKVSEDKSEAYEILWNEVRKRLTKDEIEILTSDEISKAHKLKPGWYSEAKPYYRFFLEELEDELKSIGWDKEDLLIDIKADGLRVSCGVIDGEAFFYVDPEDVKKKNPNITNRVPGLCEELKKILPDNTIVDAEFIAMHPNGKEILHRTNANALLNSKIRGEELEQFAAIFIFDVLFWKGEDIRSWPLHERLEILQQIKETDHIIVERVSKDINKKADAYVVKGNDFKKIEKILDKIKHDKIGRPKYIAEGVMIKLLDHEYEYPINHGWAKVKFLYEIDLRVLEKKKVKGTKNVYNYLLGLDIPKDYYETLVNMSTKKWYHNVGVIHNGKFYRGKESKGKDGIYVMVMGKSDNHKEKIKINVGDILRIAAEEVLKYDNPEYPEYPRYSFYIGVPLEPIPEKDVTDSIEVVDKLSQFQPKRIPIDVLRKLTEELDIDEKQRKIEIIGLPEVITYRPRRKKIEKAKRITKSMVLEWLEDMKIPEEIYEEIAKENQPLPKILYIDPREGDAWAQFHIRGITPEEYEGYIKGKYDLADIFVGHSVHIDLRMNLGLKKLVQWVITDNDIPSFIRMLYGKKRKTKGGVMNVQHSLTIVKPSAEPPETSLKANKYGEMAIDEKGAKILADLILEDYSYWIEPGEVGCVSANDLVLTIDGYKYVRELKEGDLVYTGSGTFKRITKIWDRGIVHRREIIKPQFGFCTYFFSHNIYTKDGIKQSSEITTGDYLLVPKPKFDNNPISKIILKIEPGYTKEIDVDKDFLFFLGFFVGDGSVLNHDKGQISLDCANEDEADLLEFIVKSKFNIKHVTRLVNPNGNYISLRFIDRGLAKWLSENCYTHYEAKGRRHAKHKILPRWVYYLDNNLIKSLIDGIIQSDGYVHNNKKEIYTESRRLAGQILLLLLKLGFLPSIKITTHSKNKGRGFHITYRDPRDRKVRRTLEDENYYYIPILEAKTEYGGGLHIYDIEVEDDHNFVVCNYLVKNSTEIGRAHV